jgi:hypothetical protein
MLICQIGLNVVKSYQDLKRTREALTLLENSFEAKLQTDFEEYSRDSLSSCHMLVPILQTFLF